MNSDESAKSHAKPDVTLTGAAKTCAIGPPLGLVDIGSSEHAYLFRVALPGVRHKCKYFQMNFPIGFLLIVIIVYFLEWV